MGYTCRSFAAFLQPRQNPEDPVVYFNEDEDTIPSYLSECVESWPHEKQEYEGYMGNVSFQYFVVFPSFVFTDSVSSSILDLCLVVSSECAFPLPNGS